MPGPSKTPTALALLRGNPGKRTINTREPKPEPSTAPCPAWLDRHGREFWKVYAPRLLRVGCFTELDEVMLAMACERWSAYRRAVKKSQQSDPTMPKLERGDSLAARDAFAGLMQVLAKFGMSPSDRTKIAVEPPLPADADPLDEFTRRRAQRHAPPAPPA